MRPDRRTRIGVLLAAACAWAAPLGLGDAAWGQPDRPENPVFVNDSPAAADTLRRIDEHRASGNLPEAVRLVQRLLDDEPDHLVPAGLTDEAVYVTVRERVHAVLLANADLLARYRREHTPAAEAMRERGEWVALERSRLLTTPGYEAALRVASEQLERAHFHAAARTLAQLDQHPDRRGGADAARLVSLVARYAPGSAAARLAPAWRAEAGLNAEMEPPIVGPNRPAVISPGSPQPPPQLEGLVPRALSSMVFGDLELGDRPMPGPLMAGDALPRFGKELRAWPVVRGEVVFVAHKSTVMALDRLTLRSLWRTDLREALELPAEPDGEERGNGQWGFGSWQQIDAPVIHGDFVLATLFDASRSDIGEETVVALDRATGSIRWSVVVGELDAQLPLARVRGRIMVENDRVVLGLRKDVGQRRLSALYLAGLDLADGSLRWLNLLGSVGTLPFLRAAQVSDDAALADGVIYRADRVGLLGAYEIDSGRPLWLRRMRSELADGQAAAGSWSFGAPVVAGDRLVVLSPERRAVLLIDRRTGEELGRRDADALGEPSYLLAVGDRLAAVNERRIAFTDLADPIKGRVYITPSFNNPGIRGRVVVAGDRLLAPVVGGLKLINPADPTAEPVLTTVDDAGNFVLDGGQLLVADDARLHSYLSWAQADRLLTARIESQPDDPAAAVALAELAYRAGRPERILFAVDAARAALVGRSDDAPRKEEDRLVASLRSMIVGAQRPAGDPGPKPPSTLDRTLEGDLIQRLGQIAREPSDRAAHWLHLGFFLLAQNEPADAAASYQKILASADLAGAMWRGAQLGLRADAEATRRLEQLVSAHGRAAYAAFDADAEREAAALPPDAGPERLEALVRSYPVARLAPELWGRVASAFERQDKPRAAARALDQGLEIAQRLPDAPAAQVAELAGRLLVNLRDRGLLTAAQDTLARVRTRFPHITVSVSGQPLDLAQFSAELAQRRATTERWARLGMPGAEGVQVLAGWALLEERVPSLRPSAPAVLVARHLDGRLGVFGPSAGDDAPLVLRWTVSVGEQPAELIRSGRDAAFIFHATPEGGLVERIDVQAGVSVWRSRPFPQHFQDGPPRLPGAVPAGERIRTPMEGVRDAEELLAAADDRTLLLLERAGRAVAVDADAGSTLWSASLPLRAVYDTDLAGDLMVAIGDGEVAGPGGELVALVPRVLILDARTGRLVHQIDTDLGQLRWLRLSPRGDLVVGAQAGVMAIDPEAGAVLWKNTQAPVAAALRAWIHGPSVLCVSADRFIWSINLATGALAAQPSEVPPRLDAVAATNSFFDDDRLALTSPQGLLVVNREGVVIGADALGATDNLITPVPAADAFFTIETGATSTIGGGGGGVPGGGAAFALHRLSARTAKIEHTIALGLPEPPTRLSVLDGRLAVTAGPNTFVYLARP